MGKVNLSVNSMLMRKDVFADFMNGVLYAGQQVLAAGDLELVSTLSGVFYETDDGKKNALERQGDVRMKADIGTYSVILANENQSKVHYAMPVRNMLYDVLEYVKQVQQLENEHKKAGEKLEGNEFLSGITKEDRLMPVITTVLYVGSEWDGAKSLYEMMEFGDNENIEILKNFLPDYRLNLIDINNIEDTSVFRSCLHHIFNMVRLRKDKRGLYQYLEEHREELDKFDSVERMAALVLLGEQKRVAERLNKNDQEGKDETVCEAITEMLMDSETKGRQEGKIEGENRMAKLIQALLADKRLADLERASADSDYRLQMFEEYGI